MSNKNYLFGAFILTLTLFACKTSFDCTDYKSGKFFTFSPVTENRIDVERTDTLQIETDIKSGSTIKNKIVWKSPCEYDITETSINKSTADNIDSFFLITPIKVKIIGGNKSYYIFSARIDSANKFVELTDTMRIPK
jgi:hypothetical protein